LIAVIFSTIAVCLCIFNLLVYIGIIEIYNPYEEQLNEIRSETARIEMFVKSLMKRKGDL
jgi:hypothetical protein